MGVLQLRHDQMNPLQTAIFRDRHLRLCDSDERALRDAWARTHLSAPRTSPW